MRKFIILSVLIISLYCYGEEKEIEGKSQEITASKVVELEARIDSMSTDMEKIQEEIKKISEDIKLLLKAVRSIQIYTQGSANIPPDEEAWGKIKNGMTAEEVKEIVGPPEEISLLVGRGEVWHYSGLGSITFDKNGKVVSQKTFK